MKLNNKNVMIVFVIILSQFISKGISGQYLQVIYQLDFKPSKTADSSILSEYYLLDINIAKKNTIYEALGKHQIDSINYVIANLPSKIDVKNSPLFNHKFNPSDFSFHYTIQKDFIQKKYTITENVGLNNYRVEYDFPSNDWHLIDKKNKILGYECQGAQINFGGRKWTAFYTSDIPISDGPYKFHGLPGLILSLESEDAEYKFNIKSIQNSSTNFEPTPPKIVNITPKKLLMLKSNYSSDPTISLEALSNNQNNNMSSSFNGIKNTMKKNDYIKSIKIQNDLWKNTHNNPIEINDIWIMP